ALARTLRAERYAVAYLPHRSLRTATLAWLARITKRVGFRDGWPMLYTEVRQRARTDHEIDRLPALAGPAGPTRTGRASTPPAPLHFAQAVGTPTVAIFGSTVPAFGFGPRGPRDRVVQRDGLSCRPCSAHGPPSCPLGHHLCMKSLSVEDVLLAIEETGAPHRRD